MLQKPGTGNQKKTQQTNTKKTKPQENTTKPTQIQQPNTVSAF